MTKMSIAVGLLILLMGACSGGSDEPTLPGIGTDPSVSVVENIEYRLVEVGPNCVASLFAQTAMISQNGTKITATASGQTIATGTIDSNGNVQVTVQPTDQSEAPLSCSGLFNAGSFDIACALAQGKSCDFVYTRSDLL